MIDWFKTSKSKKSIDPFNSVERQVKAWRKANRRMKWGITDLESSRLPKLPKLTETDLAEGFHGVILSYGFGDDGSGNADSVLSGKLAWDFAVKRRRNRSWQCRYIDFNKTDHFRLRPGAPPRPKGFYFSKFNPGEKFQRLAVSRLIKRLKGDTACGPEGIQFLTVTHPHFADRMNNREIPFMAFADYDVAPYGYNDFFDALQMFCSNDTLGLGIGNVDKNYPLFGIPILRFNHRDI